MVKHGLYMAMGRGCHSYLKGHVNDDRSWSVIADEEDILQIGVSWSGTQWVRYESGWNEEHKVESFSRPISYAQTVKREWMSTISGISGNHLKFWDDVMADDDYLATFRVEFDPSDIMQASGGVYCAGVEDHKDPDNKRRSALLIVHNDGFVVTQKGLSHDQPVGKILILHTHEKHSLVKLNPDGKKWAAVFFDYDADLSLKEIEESLNKTYLRVFHA